MPRLPSLRRLIEPLAKLDLRGLSRSRLERQCAANGWNRERSDPAFARYRISPSLTLDVNPRQKISFAWVTLLTWEDWDESDHPKRSGFVGARRRFDARFASALSQIEAGLGPPRRTLQDETLSLRQAAWPLLGGELVLLQSDRDIAEGLTLELRLVPRRRAGRAR